MIYNRLRYKAYNTVDCVALCYPMLKGSSFSSMCDSWISEVRFVSRSVPIVSVRIISDEQDCDYSDQEMEQHWRDALKKGECMYVSANSIILAHTVNNYISDGHCIIVYISYWIIGLCHIK